MPVEKILPQSVIDEAERRRNRKRYWMVHTHRFFEGGISRPIPVTERTAFVLATWPNYIVWEHEDG